MGNTWPYMLTHSEGMVLARDASPAPDKHGAYTKPNENGRACNLYNFTLLMPYYAYWFFHPTTSSMSFNVDQS